MLFRVTVSFLASWADAEGRFLHLEFSLRGVRFQVACVYAPNRNPEQDRFLEYVADNTDPSVPTILVRDFNTVFDQSLDRRGSVVGDTSRESTAALTRLFDDVYCIDIWRYLHPSTSGFTWSTADGCFSSRIDLVSVCDILPCPFSDHCAMFLSVSVPDAVSPGPGLCKLNTSVLEEDEYFSAISNLWAQWKRRKAVCPSLAKWWEDGKALIKGFTTSYCTRRSRLASQSRDLLTRLADHLKSRVDSGCLSCLGPYRSVLEQLSRWDIDKAKGAQVRSQVRWVEEGEVSSAFFFRLEKIGGLLLCVSPTVLLSLPRLIFAPPSPVFTRRCFLPPLQTPMHRTVCLTTSPPLCLPVRPIFVRVASPLGSVTLLFWVWLGLRPPGRTACPWSFTCISGRCLDRTWSMC